MTDEIDAKLDAMEDAQARQPVLVGLVIDASGSMLPLTDSTISGVNEFLSEQRQQQGDVTVVLTKFQTLVDVGTPQKIADIADLDRKSYMAGGMTALLDGIGLTVQVMEKELSGQRAVLCIVTDGAENASTEYQLDQIRDLLQAKQDEGWVVMYLGANQDAFSAAQQMGVASAHTANYAHTGVGTQNVYTTMSSVVTRHATGQSTHLTPEELAALADPDQ